MASYNKVVLCGRLTRDPEVKSTTGGKTVVRLSLAVDRNTKEKNTDFFDAVCWEKLGETVAQYSAKGRLLLVEGRLENRSWEKDGVKHSKTEVIASDVRFLDSAKKDSNTSNESNEPAEELSEVNF